MNMHLSHALRTITLFICTILCVYIALYSYVRAVQRRQASTTICQYMQGREITFCQNVRMCSCIGSYHSEVMHIHQRGLRLIVFTTQHTHLLAHTHARTHTHAHTCTHRGVQKLNEAATCRRVTNLYVANRSGIWKGKNYGFCLVSNLVILVNHPPLGRV